MDNEERSHLEQLGQTYVRTLRILEQQQAQSGSLTPPHIILEIQDTRANIVSIEHKLGYKIPSSQKSSTYRAFRNWEETIDTLLANIRPAFIVYGIFFFIVPIALALSSYLRIIHPNLAIALLTIGWIAGALWQINLLFSRRQDNKERLVAIASKTFLSHEIVGQIVSVYGTSAISRTDVQSEINRLLRHLTEILVRRVSDVDKAASLLLLRSNNTFEVFGQYGYTPRQLQFQVEALTIDNSMAGQVITSEYYLAVKDSTDERELRAKGITWHWRAGQQDFRGRAMAPVSLAHKVKPIGVLCLDIKRPWLLRAEDRKLLMIYADYIALLCQFLDEYAG